MRYTQDFENKMRADVEFNKFLDEHRHLDQQLNRHTKYDLWLGRQPKIDVLTVERALYAADAKRCWDLMPELAASEADYELHEAVQVLVAENDAMKAKLAALREQKPVAYIIDYDVNGKPIIRTEAEFNFGSHLFRESRPGESQHASALIAKVFEVENLNAEVGALKQDIKDLLAPYHEGCPTTASLSNAAIATYALWAQKEISRLHAERDADLVSQNLHMVKTAKRIGELERNTTFQLRVRPWLVECLSEAFLNDHVERNHRFLEESLELVQSCDCTQSEAHQLVDYVFNRPVGEKPQEVGGVMVTLAALCLAQNIDMHEAGEVELARIWTKVEKIRKKQAAKPKHSPLPM